MRVLWITNILFPKVSEELGVINSISGGWLVGMAEKLSEMDDVTFGIIGTFKIRGNYSRIKHYIDGITYYSLPTLSSKISIEKYERIFEEIYLEFRPDIIHIHGTEYPIGLYFMRVIKSTKYIVSIQGLKGPISNHYQAGITFWQSLKNYSIRDFLKLEGIYQTKRKWFNYGEKELEYLSGANVVIGRTTWDRSYSRVVGNVKNYKFCNENLRKQFYNVRKWKYESCTPYSIFLSQGSSPYKGLHMLLMAASILKRDFPNLSIRIGGSDFTKTNKLSEKLRITSYGKYINNLINSYDLSLNVEFIGPINAEEMVSEYQNANVFVCPSSIENSPNSVGEAQIIGTPVIASYVGGIPDMVTHGESGLLYRFEEVEMLANYVKSIFQDPDLAIHLSRNGIFDAEQRHDRDFNVKQMVSIYSSLL